MALEPSETQPKLEKSPTPPTEWDYPTFKEYLLSQARGKEFLLPITAFPAEIDLNAEWHGVLNAMRDKTNKDDIERVGLAGYNLTQRSLYLPSERVAEVPSQWEKNSHVARDAIVIQRSLARSRGAEGLVGILHSHPQRVTRPFGFRINRGRLSAGDLYIALTGHYGPMVGVTAGDMNSLAFKTQQSVVPTDDFEKFVDLWERDPQPKKLDELLAQKYNIALYKGQVNGVLKKVYPKR
ncbi:MAG: hypothetical protein NUV69_05610 [Candidatus Curtissbacteria bacterium]|nr:hypothetical protein [Candidatus Curtissbacteria bacterium]